MRYLHTSSPNLVKYNSKSTRKNVDVYRGPRKRTGPDGKRTWKDRIGSVYDRARRRLLEEDEDWRQRLHPEQKVKWEKYLQGLRTSATGIDESFGLRESWDTRGSGQIDSLGLWGSPSAEGEGQGSSRLEPISSPRATKPKERAKSVPSRLETPTKPGQDTALQKFLEQLKKRREMAGIESENDGIDQSTTRHSESGTVRAQLSGKSQSTSEGSAKMSGQTPRERYSNPATSSHINLRLDEISAVLEKLNNPQDSLLVVHVAGTNGKGSVCTYITSSLIASNLKVGQFISPHLIDRWDCITVNGDVIPKDTFLKIEQQVKDLCKENKIRATSFEILTACAFVYFSREIVDVAVIETGMGGRFDATNVVHSPLVSVITPISIDHTTYLGPTLNDIARHKAGIIKERCPVVVAPQPPEVKHILKETASSFKAPFYAASGYWRTPSQTRYMVENIRFDDTDPQSIPILSVVPGIAGAEQSSNVACAVTALSVLRGTFPEITETAVQNGVAKASLPGRMEWVTWDTDTRQPILLDGAHNVASCTALGAYVDQLRKDSPVCWVIAMSVGRDVQSCLSQLLKKRDTVACVEFGNVDGMAWVERVPAKELAEQARALVGDNGEVETFGKNVREAIDWAAGKARDGKGILVGTGSLYLVGHIHRILRSLQRPDSVGM